MALPLPDLPVASHDFAYNTTTSTSMPSSNASKHRILDSPHTSRLQTAPPPRLPRICISAPDLTSMTWDPTPKESSTINPISPPPKPPPPSHAHQPPTITADSIDAITPTPPPTSPPRPPTAENLPPTPSPRSPRPPKINTPPPLPPPSDESRHKTSLGRCKSDSPRNTVNPAHPPQDRKPHGATIRPPPNAPSRRTSDVLLRAAPTASSSCGCGCWTWSCAWVAARESGTTCASARGSACEWEWECDDAPAPRCGNRSCSQRFHCGFVWAVVGILVVVWSKCWVHGFGISPSSLLAFPSLSHSKSRPR